MSSPSFTSGNYYRRRRNTERGTLKEYFYMIFRRRSQIFFEKDGFMSGRHTAQHCEAEAELGAVKVIDPDWCKLHEKWMLDD
ncbi:unnamed protein product [Brassica napus]|uniref:(rape) hypothetical protein n=1 Tax=Brassica napus TaxID=3708 RepID=A0A816SL57_BRANA|nr:unnamed protein product [Brassica napus]